MICIYCNRTSPRLEYVAHHIFGRMLGQQYTITTNADEFSSTSAARINYSTANFEGDLQILPSGLLTETHIEPKQPSVGEWDGTVTIFDNGGGEMPFDIFSAVFFLLSRYEEYTDKGHDKHGRFTAPQSMAFKHEFLEKPIINIWVTRFGEFLSNRFRLNVQRKPFRVVSTIDIDQAYYVRHKGLIRNMGGMAKQVLSGKVLLAFQRLLVLLYLRKDPNNNFAYQQQIHQKTGIRPTYFFHVGDNGPYDRPTRYTKRAFRNIVERLAPENEIGIHPSYGSYNNPDIILKEKKRLEDIIGRPITKSRQHFLRFTLPETYHILMDCGITDEYSMGYAENIGYRAGISTPFLWYDLERDKVTELTVHPFAIMDVTLKNYMKLQPMDAMVRILVQMVFGQEYGGELVGLWHNESLSDWGEWKGWRQVYEYLLTFEP